MRLREAKKFAQCHSAGRVLPLDMYETHSRAHQPLQFNLEGVGKEAKHAGTSPTPSVIQRKEHKHQGMVI